MINLCVYEVPPSPIYKGVEEGGGPALYGVPWRSPTPTGSRIPPFPSWTRREGRGEREEGKGGAAPLVQFGPEGEGGRGLPWSPLSLSPLWPNKAHTLTGGFR